MNIGNIPTAKLALISTASLFALPAIAQEDDEGDHGNVVDLTGNKFYTVGQ